MSSYDRRNWVRQVFYLRGWALPLILPKVIVVSLVAALVNRLEVFGWLPELPVTYFTVAGLALSLLLAFRVNASYDRFWEGRKAWGAIVNRSRNLARQLATALPQDEARRGAALITAFAHATRRQLRRETAVPELAKLLSAADAASIAAAPRPALAVLAALGCLLATARHERRLDSIDESRMEADVAHLTDQIGICERIQSTPIPIAFVVYLRHLLIGYCIGLPMVLHQPSNSSAAPLGTALIACVFFGLDRIAIEIEDPFEATIHGLDLDGICARIETDVLGGS